MIKKLKRKIVVMIMAIVGVLAVACCVGISAYQTTRIKEELYSSMEMSAESVKIEIGKDKYQKVSPTPICIVEYDRQTVTIINSEEAYMDEETILAAVKEIILSDKEKGILESENLVYVLRRTPDGIRIAFADRKYLTGEISKVWLTAGIVTFLFLAVMAAIAWYLAKIASRPVAEFTEAQKQFIADASHELKTPLSVLRANNKILLSQTTDQPKLTEWLTTNEEEIDLMNSIITDMLSLAQCENMSQIEKEDVDLSKEVDKICLTFDTVAYEKNIVVNAEIGEHISMNCNPKLIKRCLTVFVDNAIKYESENGTVDVRLKKESGQIVYSVTNRHGCIAKEDIPHIFDRFYKSDKARTSSGVGLGLAIAKQIVDLHQGEIRVTSSQENGTVFKIFFPCKK